MAKLLNYCRHYSFVQIQACEKCKLLLGPNEECPFRSRNCWFKIILNIDFHYLSLHFRRLRWSDPIRTPFAAQKQCKSHFRLFFFANFLAVCSFPKKKREIGPPSCQIQEKSRLDSQKRGMICSTRKGSFLSTCRLNQTIKGVD